MKIKNVAIEAFRCFDYQSLDFEREDGRLANLIVLYAPNGFGKTSLFDAIEYGVTRSVNRFTKGVYDKDNRVDKNLERNILFFSIKM
ncbi:AAA family ATPase [Bacteroides fragilis]|nr:AAA family ATPase [Bacteroides fragilis]